MLHLLLLVIVSLAISTQYANSFSVRNGRLGSFTVGNKWGNGSGSSLLSLKHVRERSAPVISITSSSLRFKVADNDRSLETDVEVDEDEDEDDDDDDDDDEDDDDKAVGLMKRISSGVIPVGASLGFALTRSPAIAVRLAGAAAGGALGVVVRNIIASRMKLAESTGDGGSDDGDDFGNGSAGQVLAPSVVSTIEMLKTKKTGPNLIDLTVDKLEKIAERNKVKEEDLGLLFTYVFADVVFDATESASLDLTELQEVLEFAQTLNLEAGEIGDGFALAASRLGRTLETTERGFYVEEIDQSALYQASKMFFLADKMLDSPTSGYYGRRFAITANAFIPSDYKGVISDACTKLFKKCVESVLGAPEKFEQNEVDDLRVFLSTSTETSSLRPASMQNLIMEAIQFMVDKEMNLETVGARNANIGDYNKFKQAQEILGWSARDLDATVEQKTLPIFKEVARSLADEAFEHPDRAEALQQELDERILSLNVDSRKARVELTTIISDMNSQYMEKIDKVYNVSGGVVGPAFKIMTTYAASHKAFETMTKNLMEGSDTTVPLPGLPFVDMVRVSMYEIQLQKGKNTGVREDMFDLNEEQRKLVKKNLALPKVSSWIKQCISESNFNDDAKAAYNKLLTEYEVGPTEWASTSVDFYYQEASMIANSKAVPTQADMERLTKLSSFLSTSAEVTERVNLQLFGDKYVKALTEAMTPTGVVTEDYIDGLERLRNRLQLSKPQTETLLGYAARSRIGPIVKDLADIWKSDTDGNYRREKERKEEKSKGTFRDKSRDNIDNKENVFGYMEVGAQKEGGGPNVFMREALNLIDFVSENCKVQGFALSDSLSSFVTSVGIVPEGDLTGMYKHYLITRLGEQDETLRQRYSDADAMFGQVLGISSEGQQKLKESLAYSAFKGLLQQVLMYKEQVEARDMQQFAILKDSLNLEQEAAEKILDESSKDALVEYAKTLFQSPDGASEVTITAASARKFRNQLVSVGPTFKELQFTEALVTYLYALEVQELIESGRESELADVQEAYDLEEEQAQEVVELACKRYISQLLNLALRSAKKFDEVGSTKYLAEIVKYAVFVSGTVESDGNLFSEADKVRLLGFFQGMDKEEGEEGEEVVEAEDMLSKLKEMIFLTEDFVPPEQGIQGLLGKGQSLGQLELDQGADKKAWSWG